MKVKFDTSFERRLSKIKDPLVLNRVKKTILLIESVDSFAMIPHVKKMEGFKTFYRIRIADYRIGIEVKGDTVIFIIVAHRKEIYRAFP